MVAAMPLASYVPYERGAVLPRGAADSETGTLPRPTPRKFYTPRAVVCRRDRQAVDAGGGAGGHELAGAAHLAVRAIEHRVARADVERRRRVYADGKRDAAVRRLQLTAWAEGKGRVVRQVEQVTDPNAIVDVTLRPACTIEFVVGADGKPAANVAVQALGAISRSMTTHRT